MFNPIIVLLAIVVSWAYLELCYVFAPPLPCQTIGQTQKATGLRFQGPINVLADQNNAWIKTLWQPMNTYTPTSVLWIINSIAEIIKSCFYKFKKTICVQ